MSVSLSVRFPPIVDICCGADAEQPSWRLQPRRLCMRFKLMRVLLMEYEPMTSNRIGLCLPNIMSAVLAASLVLIACGKSPPDDLDDSVRPEHVQENFVTGKVEGAASFAEPPRYLRLNDLAADIREAGHGCESIRTYAALERPAKGTGVYKVDCLEYSYELTITNGRGQIRRLRKQ